MKREIIYRYFSGTASTEEKRAVKGWVESGNEEAFMKERMFFDMLTLATTDKAIERQVPAKKRRLISITKEIMKIAAVSLVLLSIGFYAYEKKMDEISTQTNLVMVPAGQRVNLILPDGTNVWLNALTEIKYPSLFTGNKREIELNGEAYFEVTHDPENPFIVKTKDYNIEVLGTKFNVEAYTSSKDFTTSLLDGAVKIIDLDNPKNEITLKRNQKASKSAQGLTVSMIDDYDMYRWKEGLICFKNITFSELMKRFEKHYDIRIVINNPELSKMVFNGKFRISDGVDNALRVLQKKAKYSFVRNSEDSVIYIY